MNSLLDEQHPIQLRSFLKDRLTRVMAEFGVYMDVDIKVIPSTSLLWEEGASQTYSCSSIRFDGTQVMHFITLVANVAILIETGTHHDWNSSNIGDYTLYAISVNIIALALSVTNVITMKNTRKQMQDHRIMLCFFYSYVGACFVAIEEPCQRTFFTFSTAAYSTVIATCMVGNAFGLTLKGIGAQFCLYASSTVVIMSSITHVKDKSHNISEATHVIVLSCVTCIFILFITSDKVQRSISSDMVTMLAYSILLMYWIILAYLDGSYLLSLKTPVSSLTMELESE